MRVMTHAVLETAYSKTVKTPLTVLADCVNSEDAKRQPVTAALAPSRTVHILHATAAGVISTNQRQPSWTGIAKVATAK